MLNFTCGSTKELDLAPFDGVVIGYHWDIFKEIIPNTDNIPEKFENKIIRSQFLYGNKNKKPPEKTECETIEQWIYKRISKFTQVKEWVLINEFTDDCGTPYQHYGLESLKRYCDAAYSANPDIDIIIGDFRPWNINKWMGISKIINDLKKSGFPVKVGIQTHIKTKNALVFIKNLPNIIDMFNLGDVHLIEASLWYFIDLDYIFCKDIWLQLIEICESKKVVSFCDWWLNVEDSNVGRRMPTFEKLNLYTKDNING